MTDHFWVGFALVQLSQYRFRYPGMVRQTSDETRPMPQHNAFKVVLSGGVFGGGGGVVAVGERCKSCRKPRCVEHSGVSRRGGVRHWLLYVELWRYRGRPGRWVS